MAHHPSFKLTPKLALAASALLAGVAAAPTAMAGDGLYVSGSIGGTQLGHSIRRNTGAQDVPSISTLTEETDLTLRFGLGYKQHVTDRVFLAAEAFYAWENGSTSSVNGVLVSDLDLESSFGGDVRFGYDITDDFALYGLAGVTWLKFDNDTSYTFAPPVNTLSQTEAGFTYGLGAEVSVTDRISLIGEYRITNDVSFTPNADRVGDIVNDNDIDRNSLRLGLNFSF